jgi:hypothetical protein
VKGEEKTRDAEVTEGIKKEKGGLRTVKGDRKSTSKADTSQAGRNMAQFETLYRIYTKQQNTHSPPFSPFRSPMRHGINAEASTQHT